MTTEPSASSGLAYLWVALGGALGSVARHWLSCLAVERWGETFPWGTLLVNVSGSLIIGVFAAWSEPEGRWSVPPAVRQFVMIGVCGGYTTFSSFSLQTLKLMQNGQWLHAGGNAGLSVAACLIAVWIGYLLGRVAR